MPTAIQPNNSTTPTSHVVQVTSSIGLLVGLVAIIILAAWISHRHNPPLRVSPFTTSFRQDQVRQRKMERKVALDSIPVVKYRSGLQHGERKRENKFLDLVTYTGSTKKAPHVMEINDILHDPDSEKEEARCPVCTEDLVENERVRILPCGHIYHQQCIDPWLLGKTTTCPLW